MKFIINMDYKAVGHDTTYYHQLVLDHPNTPSALSGLDWDTETSTGVIFYNDGRPMEPITELPDWALAADAAWEAEHALHPTPEENKNNARGRLFMTDWVEVPSYTDTSNTHHLTNKDEFEAYRQELLAIYRNPPQGEIDWPVAPEEKWN